MLKNGRATMRKCQEDVTRQPLDEKQMAIAIQAMKAAKERACWEELQAVLKKHGCQLQPVTILTAGTIVQKVEVISR